MLSRYLQPIALAAIAAAVVWFVIPEWIAQQDRLQTLQHNVQLLHDQAIAEQVVDLPEDGARWHWVTVLKDKDNLTDHADKHLLSLYAYAPTAAVKAQCHQNVYTPESEMWKERFAPKLGEDTPQFILIANNPADETQDGKVIYKRTADAIPRDPQTFYAELKAAIQAAGGRPCPGPGPCPKPTPSPQPSPSPGPPLIPDTPSPDQPSADEPTSLWFIVLILLGAALAGAMSRAKKDE